MHGEKVANFERYTYKKAELEASFSQLLYLNYRDMEDNIFDSCIASTDLELKH